MAETAATNVFTAAPYSRTFGTGPDMHGWVMRRGMGPEMEWPGPEIKKRWY